MRAVYPNLGLRSSDGKRCVIVHHGHYIESMYQLMSSLNLLMFNKPLPRDITEIEGDNFASVSYTHLGPTDARASTDAAMDPAHSLIVR